MSQIASKKRLNYCKGKTMDQLIAKITSLSYELFGIFLPGLIFVLFFSWSWWSLDAYVSVLSLGYLQPLTFPNHPDGVLNVELRFGLVVFLTVASYFLGHLAFW